MSVRVAVVNLTYQQGENRTLVETACEESDVVLACEALKVGGDDLLDLAALVPDGWAVWQDTTSPAKAGSAVLWRTATMDARAPRRLVEMSPANQHVRARHLAAVDLNELATGDGRTYAAFHAPLPKTGLQDEFYTNLRTWALANPKAVLGGDCNRRPGAVGELLGRASTGGEVMGLFWPSGVVGVVAGPTHRSGSDHPIIRATLATQEAPVTRGIYPKAVQKIIPAGDNDPPITPRIAILHVDAGNAGSLHDFFATRSGGIESHFHVQRDGGVEQYRNIFRQADANLDANDFAVSIETQGFGEGEWTPAQLVSIKTLLQWLNSAAEIPLIRCTAWDGKGVGHHTMWGAPSHWTPVAKSCPGPDRKVQFEKVIVPWMRSLTEPRPTPRWDAIWEQAATILANAEGRTAEEVEDAERVKRLAARHSTKH